MKYTKNELLEMANNATQVEVYEYTDRTKRIHTDTVKYIGNSCFDNSEIDTLTFDEKGEVDVDAQIMDREDYSNTILANCGERWEDMYEDDDKILVIVVR